MYSCSQRQWGRGGYGDRRTAYAAAVSYLKAPQGHGASLGPSRCFEVILWHGVAAATSSPVHHHVSSRSERGEGGLPSRQPRA